MERQTLVLKSESGRRYPLTLSMMLFDSSGVNKDAARKEHREAIEACASRRNGWRGRPVLRGLCIRLVAYDWLMAHREDPDSAAIQIPKGHDSDAGMIVAAACASVGVRVRIDQARRAQYRSTDPFTRSPSNTSLFERTTGVFVTCQEYRRIAVKIGVPRCICCRSNDG